MYNDNKLKIFTINFKVDIPLICVYTIFILYTYSSFFLNGNLRHVCEKETEILR